MSEIAYKARLDAEAEAAANETLMEAAGLTDGVIVPGSAAQTDPNLSIDEQMREAEEMLRGNGTQMTEEFINRLVSNINESIINNPNASVARKQEAQRLLEETFGVLETSTTYEDKTFADELYEELAQDFKTEDI